LLAFSHQVFKQGEGDAMEKMSYLPMTVCFLCATHFCMNKAAGSIGSNTTRPASVQGSIGSNTTRAAAQPQKTVQVLSGRIGANLLALGDVPAPTQAEPIRETAKSLDAKFVAASKR
jgi:hypothetical protein